MISWIKLRVICEGDTESLFVRNSLKPHLKAWQVSVEPIMLFTNRPLRASGGAISWDRFAFYVNRLLKQHSAQSDRFSTLIDWYKLDPDFPGFAESRKIPQPARRAVAVAQAVQRVFDSQRFLPFFTLHEFEALLFCDLSALQTRLPDHEKEITALRAEIGSIPPEEINDGAETHPSARLEKHIPGYRRAKKRVGAPAAADIGLPILREKCPHFGQWLTSLEKLSQQT